MKKPILLSILFASLFTQAGLSFAESANNNCHDKQVMIKDEAAQQLITVMKAAGFSTSTSTPAKKGDDEGAINVIHYLLGSVSAYKTEGGAYADGISTYGMHSAPLGIAMNSGNGKLIFDALEAIGVYNDGGMMKINNTAGNLQCSITIINKGPNHYGCAITATWADDCN